MFKFIYILALFQGFILFVAGIAPDISLGTLSVFILSFIMVSLAIWGLNEKPKKAELVRLDYKYISSLYYSLSIIYGVKTPSVCFERKNKKYLGVCTSNGDITFYGYSQTYLSTVLHEFAHHIQFQLFGVSNHKRQFKELLSELEAWVEVFGGTIK